MKKGIFFKKMAYVCLIKIRGKKNLVKIEYNIDYFLSQPPKKKLLDTQRLVTD